MTDFFIRQITPEEAGKVISEIGFDESYISAGIKKYEFKLYKICNLTCAQATIVKQVALSAGADAAVHREVLVCGVESSDLLIGATAAQLETICTKLLKQPFGLKELARQIKEKLSLTFPPSLTIREKTFDWAAKTYIMGILNLTPDSSSDGGKYLDPDIAVEHAKKMIDDEADIIDIGGESTKPFSQEVMPDEEMRRVLPIIERIRAYNDKIPISIDTRHSETAKKAVEAGVDIINDVSGLDWDEKMAATAAELAVPVVIMHSLGSPDVMQQAPTYSENVVDAVYKDLYTKTQKALSAGIKPENIIIDPGIGFGKAFEHNIELIKRIEEFKTLGYPILIGVSRKSVIAKVLNVPPMEREEAAIALNSYAASKGANIIRVHEVNSHYKALKVLDCVIRNF